MLKRILFTVMLLGFGSYTYAAQVLIEPQFSDPRFQPADKLHAGCLHKAKINIKTSENEDISSFRFIISYEPETIEILNIKPNDKYKDILDSKIEYDRIIVSILNANIPNGSTTEIFEISFKSKENAISSLFAIRKPSYLMNKENKEIPIFVEKELIFEKVPECEPDIIAPTISLAKPQNTDTLLGLDSYFVFLIKDSGKGIDKDSVSIVFDGKTYTGKSEFLLWSEDYLSFYPQKWIPVNKELELEISVSDKQIYGGANKTSRSFGFSSNTTAIFENNITPAIYRNLVGKLENIYATEDECDAIKFLIQNTSSLFIPIEKIENLNKKINCAFDETTIVTESIEKTKTRAKSTVFLSVFSVLGWLLFGITFILKLHYLASYKKHKKISKSLQASESKD